MAQAFKPTLTDKGTQLLNSIGAGGILTITRAQLGDGKLPELSPIEPLQALVSPKVAAQLKYGEGASDGKAVIAVQFDNKELQTQLAINEVGIFAKANGGAEVLYCYMTFGDQPEVVQPAHVGRFVRSFDIPIRVDNKLQLQVEISPSALVSAQDFGKLLDGTVQVGKAKDSDKLGGQIPSYYAKNADLTPSKVGAYSKSEADGLFVAKGNITHVSAKPLFYSSIAYSWGSYGINDTGLVSLYFCISFPSGFYGNVTVGTMPVGFRPYGNGRLIPGELRSTTAGIGLGWMHIHPTTGVMTVYPEDYARVTFKNLTIFTVSATYTSS